MRRGCNDSFCDNGGPDRDHGPDHGPDPDPDRGRAYYSPLQHDKNHLRFYRCPDHDPDHGPDRGAGRGPDRGRAYYSPSQHDKNHLRFCRYYCCYHDDRDYCIHMTYKSLLHNFVVQDILFESGQDAIET